MPRTARPPRDPLALVGLLWEPSTRVGRSGVTIASLVTAAIGLTDVEGLSALTMRRVADDVGVPVMTLYGHVPGKAELIELMLDRVAGATYAGHDVPGEVGDWRAGLEHIAQRVFEHGCAHPWALEVPPARPVLGPGVCRTYELELAPLDGIGLELLEMDETLTAVRSLATSAARWQVTLDGARRDSQLTDLEWWELVGPRIAQAMRDEHLPISSKVGQAVASAGDPQRTLTAGLTLMLDGLERRLHAR